MPVFACRDLVHRQTACWAVKHMALGVYGFGFEDAMTHLFNLVWPNMFEVSPHMVQAFTDAVDGMRVSVGPGKVLSYLLQARALTGHALHAQRTVTAVHASSSTGLISSSSQGARCLLEDLQQPVHWGSSMTCTHVTSSCAHTHTHKHTLCMHLHSFLQDALVAAYPRVRNDERNMYVRYELDYFL